MLVGAGQLGSRYLQGLRRVTEPLEIAVVDPSATALEVAAARWSEVDPGAAHPSPQFAQALSPASTHTTERVDLAIVATSAGPRPQVVADVASRFAPHHWILEKVLAQSSADVRRLVQAIGVGTRAVVNTPRRIWAGYTKLRQEVVPPIEVEVQGFRWGLASNAIHMIDLVSWLASESVRTVSIESGGEWYATKRAGYLDLVGRIEAHFSRGSRLKMISQGARQARLIVTIIDSVGERWVIDEASGKAQSSSGTQITVLEEFQSDMTSHVVADLLTEGECGLPSLALSARMHEPLLDALLQHWNATKVTHDHRVPIT